MYKTNRDAKRGIIEENYIRRFGVFKYLNSKHTYKEIQIY